MTLSQIGTGSYQCSSLNREVIVSIYAVNAGILFARYYFKFATTGSSILFYIEKNRNTDTCYSAIRVRTRYLGEGVRPTK